MRSEYVYAARSRWRANLLDYGAAMHEGVGDTATAATKRAEAELFRLDAELNEALGHAKETFADTRDTAIAAADKATLSAIVRGELKVADLPGVQDALDAVLATRSELRDTVKVWRQIDGLYGNRARNSILNNFTEPTTAELIATIEGTV